jgi:hypothetical protein
VDIELGGDLGAVDDEGLVELILELEQSSNGGVDDTHGSQQQRWGAAEFGLGLAGSPIAVARASTVGLASPRVADTSTTVGANRTALMANPHR